MKRFRLPFYFSTPSPVFEQKHFEKKAIEGKTNVMLYQSIPASHSLHKPCLNSELCRIEA